MTRPLYKFIIMKQSSPNSKTNGIHRESTRQTAAGTARNTENRSGENQDRASQATKPHESSKLEKFFIRQLQDIYYVEQKLTKALGTMRDAATTDELKDAFSEHLQQTEKHAKRLDKVFAMINQKPEAKKCEAIEGLVREVENIIGETEEGTMTRDAALIMAAQKVEHYEIATYGALVQFAITMNLHDAADLLDRTLREEEDTDANLTEIAENDINLNADHEGIQYSWQTEKVTSAATY